MQLFTPMQYLMIDVANNFGHDKLTWEERLSWFRENEDRLDALQKEAENPALYYTGVNAYRQAQMGMTVHYPISLDATASGAQILAALVCCEKSALLCNVLDNGGQRMDLYTALFEIMQGSLEEAAGDDAIIVPGSNITRKQVKKAVMTALYGSKKEPKAAFGDGPLLDLFYATMDAEAPGIWRLTEALLGLWDPKAYSNNWVLPDNFHVRVKVMDKIEHIVRFADQELTIVEQINRPIERSLSLGANITHSIDGLVVREMGRRCNFDIEDLLRAMEAVTGMVHGRSMVRPQDKLLMKLWDHYKASGFLSARILSVIDENNVGLLDDVQPIVDLIKAMPEKPFHILAVHDCFRVHPNYGNDVRRQYNQILYEIARSNLLVYVTSQVIGKQTQASKYQPEMADRILQANYALS